MILYKGYQNEPISLSGPMKYNRLIKTSIFDNSNLIWKIINKDNEMSSFLNKLNKYQRYNHFPNGIKLGYKYNLFNYFHKMKKNFQMTIIICQKIINFVNLKNYFLKI